MTKIILLPLLSVIITMIILPEAIAELPARRRAQFASDKGHILIPAPYSLKGIGEGIVIFGSANNIAGSYTDIFATVITGDIKGTGAGFTEYHILKERLFVDFTVQSLSKAVIQGFSGRGMETSKDDYSLVELDNMLFTGGRLTLSFGERMFELYALGYDGSFRIGTLRDPDGEVVAYATDSAEDRFSLYGVGLVLDITDDRSDPRRGMRFDTNFGWSPPRGVDNADYIVMDNNLSGYLPVGTRSTWVFNYFRSAAIVRREGETGRDRITEDLGFHCETIADVQRRANCEDSTTEYIDNIIASNRHGTASSLGGRSRLRSFPADRYKGAHTAFAGTEFRWNITEESTPFNIGVVKDIRTGIQAAFFHEIGSVAESSGDLWQHSRSSTGAGLRVVNASGLIYRIDWATGSEGPALTVIINYPWDTF